MTAEVLARLLEIKRTRLCDARFLAADAIYLSSQDHADMDDLVHSARMAFRYAADALTLQAISNREQKEKFDQTCLGPEDIQQLRDMTNRRQASSELLGALAINAMRHPADFTSDYAYDVSGRAASAAIDVIALLSVTGGYLSPHLCRCWLCGRMMTCNVPLACNNHCYCRNCGKDQDTGG